MNKPTAHYNLQSDTFYFLVRDGEEERFVEVAEGVEEGPDRESKIGVER